MILSIQFFNVAVIVQGEDSLTTGSSPRLFADCQCWTLANKASWFRSVL